MAVALRLSFAADAVAAMAADRGGSGGIGSTSISRAEKRDSQTTTTAMQ